MALARKLAAFISAAGNLVVQYNLNSATISIPFISHAHAAEPEWAADSLKGATFVGAFCGMILFGALGDSLGHRPGMILALSVVLLAVAASAFAPFVSPVWELLIIARFVLGVGVGGIYPMSAAIAAEAGGAAPDADDGEDEQVGVMRAARAFFFQSLGSPLPYLIAMLLLGVGGAPTPAKTSAQAAALLGLGALPAALVLAATVLTARGTAPGGTSPSGMAPGGKAAALAAPSVFAVVRAQPELLASLVGTASCWFLYDVSVYGISVFAPEILESIYGTDESLFSLCWQTTIVSLLGIPACALAIFALPRLGGRGLMAWGFVANALCFIALGAAYALAPAGAASLVKFLLFCLASFSLSWGPNVATFVAPVDAFPPALRGTFHGLSAASGKAGAALGAFLFPVVVSALGVQAGAQAIFFLQVGVNAAGAVVAWRFLPVAGARRRWCDGGYAQLEGAPE